MYIYIGVVFLSGVKRERSSSSSKQHDTDDDYNYYCYYYYYHHIFSPRLSPLSETAATSFFGTSAGGGGKGRGTGD